MTAKSKSQALLSNTLILSLGKLSSQVVTFLLVPYYTHELSPQQYGLADLLLTYVTLAAPLFTLQIEIGTFRYLIDARGDKRNIDSVISNSFSVIVGLAFIVCILLTAINQIHPLRHSLVFGVTVVATMLCEASFQALRGLGKNKVFSFAGMIASLCGAATGVLLIRYTRLGGEAILWSIAVANITGILYSWVHIMKLARPSFKLLDRHKQLALIGYSVPLVPNSISWWAINASDRTILTLLVGMAANGIYAVSNRFSGAFFGVLTIFNMAWSEAAALHIHAPDKDIFFSKTANAVISFFGILTLVVITIVSLCFHFLVGTSYDYSYYYVPPLIIAAFFSGISNFYSAIYMAVKRTKEVAYTTAWAAILNIITTLILVKYFGIWGASLATVISYYILSVLRHRGIKNYVTIEYNKKNLVYLLIFALCTIVGYYFGSMLINLITLIVLVCLAYIFNQRIFRMMWQTVSFRFLSNQEARGDSKK